MHRVCVAQVPEEAAAFQRLYRRRDRKAMVQAIERLVRRAVLPNIAVDGRTPEMGELLLWGAGPHTWHIPTPCTFP